ncbi:MAG: SAM-dependent methyltransferase [Lachnospiraceae bacterium]|nr:SAM-dependent methyltransferase [Lachnospiraceae bacterium]
MTLSKRLQAVADRIPPSTTYADIGCDHGYLPIALVLSGTVGHAIAMDLRKGPLERAREHVAQNGLEDRIELRLSDGADALTPEDHVDTITVTGMGGRLLLRILERGAAIFQSAHDIFVSPQSDIPLVRGRVLDLGYAIVDESMVEDDGKYYVILHLQPAEPVAPIPDLSKAELLYGACLRSKKDPVLYEFLLAEQKQTMKICETLKDATTKAAQSAYKRAAEKLKVIESALLDQKRLGG